MHYPELASWMVPLAFFTWSSVSPRSPRPEILLLRTIHNHQAVASSARDIILCGVLTTLAIGTTIACCLFAYGSGVNTGIKVAAYFWLISSILAWWRVTVYLVEEAFGTKALAKYFPLFRTPWEKHRPLLAPGLGEPGVKRGMPGVA